MLQSELMLGREHRWFASDLVQEHSACLPTVIPLHDHQCQERENTHRHRLLYVTLASVSVVRIAFKLAFDYVNAAVCFLPTLGL